MYKALTRLRPVFKSAFVPARKRHRQRCRFRMEQRQVFGLPVYVAWWSVTLALLVGVVLGWLVQR